MGQDRRNRRKFMRITMKRYRKNLSKIERRDEFCEHIWRYKVLNDEEFGWKCELCEKEIVDR